MASEQAGNKAESKEAKAKRVSQQAAKQVHELAATLSEATTLSQEEWVKRLWNIILIDLLTHYGLS